MSRSSLRLWGVVPVKPFGVAKRRLAPLLSPEERSRLARAMFEDVLSSIAGAPSLVGVTVVTTDPEAATTALAMGASVMSDEDGTGLTAALTKALQRLPSGGRDGVLIVAADVPAIRATDVEAIAGSHHPAPAVTLVAARDGGTNALACSPMNAIALHFGRHSFRQHVGAARVAGIVPQAPILPRVALDIDRPEDVLALLARRTPTRSHAYLTTLGIEDRLGLNPMLAAR